MMRHVINNKKKTARRRVAVVLAAFLLAGQMSAAALADAQNAPDGTPHDHTEACYTGEFICGFPKKGATGSEADHTHVLECRRLDCPLDRAKKQNTANTSVTGNDQNKEKLPRGLGPDFGFQLSGNINFGTVTEGYHARSATVNITPNVPDVGEDLSARLSGQNANSFQLSSSTIRCTGSGSYISYESISVTPKSGLKEGYYEATLLVTGNHSQSDSITVRITVERVQGAGFVAVEYISGVPSSMTAGTSLRLAGTVNPSTATYRAITWSVEDAGATNASLKGNVLTAPNAGTVKVRAEIPRGVAADSPYVESFSVTVSEPSPPPAYVTVTDITGVPASVTVGTNLTLTGTVAPSNAKYQTIVWSIANTGGTGASIKDNVLHTPSVGTVTLRATIADGKAEGIPYVKTFAINVYTPSSSGGGSGGGSYHRGDDAPAGQWKYIDGKFYYILDDENGEPNGPTLKDQWVDEDYYVGADGAMLTNQWIKTSAGGKGEAPDEAWYYLGTKGKVVTAEQKKIAGKTYYFDEGGRMRYGWYQDEDGDVYWLGGEDVGWRAESQWLWLDAPTGEDGISGHGDYDGDPCDEEGWYYFGIDGKMCRKVDRKNINGKSYYFNEHGQMLYQWINDSKVKVGSNASLDGESDSTQPDDMQYLTQGGSRADGWYELDGSKDTATDDSTAWYFFKDGEAMRADMKKPANKVAVDGDGKPVWREKIKIKASSNKYFCFDEYGRMQTGLQLLSDGFYYFDQNGYMMTGKQTKVEDDEGSWTFYFNTKNGNNGQGLTGEKSGYLYWNGKRLDAEDDYRIYTLGGEKYYLVNSSGKLQKSEAKHYDIELNGDGLYASFNKDDSVRALYTEKDLSPGHLFNNGKIIADTPRIDLYDKVFTPFSGTEEAEQE